MSESDLPPPPPPQPGPPARSMADIARMFLDGARPIAEQGTPRRLGPNQRANPMTNSSDTVPAAIQQAEARGGREQQIDSPRRLGRVMLALGAIDGENRNLEPIMAAAAGLAKKERAAVGILSLQRGILALHVAVPSNIELPALKPAGGSADVQIARALFTLRHAVAHWILAAPHADSPDFPRLAAAIPDWLLATSTANDHVVAVYQEFKRALAISSPDHDPIAVMLSTDPVNAGAVHARLRRATAEFLKKDLPLAAVAPMTASPAERVAEFDVGTDPADQAAAYAAVLDELCGTLAEPESDNSDAFEDEVIEPAAASDTAEGPPAELSFDDAIGEVSIDIDGPLDAATAAAVDLALHADASAAAHNALFDQLTNVLDPEEREALNAELFEPAQASVPVAEPATSIGRTEERQPPAPSHNPPAHAAPAPAPGALPSLRVFDLEAGTLDRPRQWQAIEPSIRDLSPGSVVLDARPPMSWASESCLAFDAEGRLHVWLLYQDGVSWFALREWAIQHRQILALTRREGVFAPEKAPTVHLVLPLEPAADNPSAALLHAGAEGLNLYRLRQIEWGAKRGILVIPLS